MLEAEFKHHDLKLIEPAFGSSLTALVINLDHLRKKQLMGSTPPKVFFQLKEIFHFLESIGSARIEGNNTTIAEFIETTLESPKTVSPNIKEIQNIAKAMDFIDEHIKQYPINRIFISEMHRMVVDQLPTSQGGEGDHTPGEYRKVNVKIASASHRPPDYIQVDQYMNELFNFVNNQDIPQYDLLKIAIAHHRFVWIHPFSNGNGRTVRLFTYAMLVKWGFNVDKGRILNPTAIFCNNRNDYYNYLAQADTGVDSNILTWCEYVLRGLKEEIEKIDKLLDYKFLKNEILLPTINYSLERQHITEIESKILKCAIDKATIKAGDLKDIFSGKASSEISLQIKKLIDKKMLMPEREGARKYTISFSNNYLLRGIIRYLGEKGFSPIKDVV